MTRLGGLMFRFRYLLYALIGIGASVPAWFLQRNVLTDFYWFVYGGRALAGSMPGYHAGPLHLYALHPELQIGPVPLLANTAISWLPVGVERAAWYAMVMSLALVTARACERLRGSVPQWQILVQGFIVVGGFGTVAWWNHLDDALALTGFAVAAAAIRRRQAWWVVAIALGAAAMCKPWAIVAAPMLLALPRSTWLRAGAVYIAAAAGPWLPFVLADHRTISALGSFLLYVNENSGLRLLGLQPHTIAPSALHALQLLLGLAFGAMAMQRGKWAAVPLVALTARLLIEPRFYPYYGAAPVVAAVIWDAERGHRVPWWALGVAAVEYGPVLFVPGMPVALAQVTLSVVILVVTLARPLRTTAPIAVSPALATV